MTITISKKEYFKLKLSSEKLSMLQNGGVDNWNGYGESLYPDDEVTISDIEEDLKIEIFGEQN